MTTLPVLREGEPADYLTDPAPTGIEIFHAMDATILQIAAQYHGGELRIPNPVGALHEGMYFADGINSNPLVPTSNPAHIARRIVDGLHDLATRDGILRFARVLYRNGIVDIASFSVIRRLRPSRQVCVIRANTSAVPAAYRPLDDGGNFADEFITRPDASVSPDVYDLVVEERHDFTDGQYDYSVVFET